MANRQVEKTLRQERITLFRRRRTVFAVFESFTDALRYK